MRKRDRNGGFSMVELIVVVAIMAALTSILVPQYLKYVQQSKINTDITNADRVRNAVTVALSDEEVPLELPAEGATITVTEADLVPNVEAFPLAKVDESFAWEITIDSTGIILIELGGDEIWPNPYGPSGYRTKHY